MAYVTKVLMWLISKTYQEWARVPEYKGATRVASTRVLGSSTVADLGNEECQTTPTNICIMRLREKTEVKSKKGYLPRKYY